MFTQRAATSRIALAIAVLLFALASVTGASADSYYPGSLTGSDVSYPQCGTLPSSPGAFVIVDVTAGRAFSQNGCLADEFAWAANASTGTPPSLYMNLQYPIGMTASYAMSGPIGITPVREERAKPAVSQSRSGSLFARQSERATTSNDCLHLGR